MAPACGFASRHDLAGVGAASLRSDLVSCSWFHCLVLYVLSEFQYFWSGVFILVLEILLTVLLGHEDSRFLRRTRGESGIDATRPISTRRGCGLALGIQSVSLPLQVTIQSWLMVAWIYDKFQALPKNMMKRQQHNSIK